MGCGMGLIKTLLFIFNFVFAVCGLGILVLGVLTHLEYKDVSQHIDVNTMLPSITLIVIGSIIFVISFFGCCGAIRRSHCMIVTFASMLLFILLVQVAVAIYAFVVIKNVDHVDIRSNYEKLFKNYSTNPESKEIVDIVQSGLHCCGVDSMNDYITTSGVIPWSCCGNTEGKNCMATSAYQVGCAQELQRALSTAGTILGAVAVAIAGVELIGIIFALCLANSIKNEDRRSYRV